VLRLIMREGMTVGAIGIGVGVARGTLALRRVLTSLMLRVRSEIRAETSPWRRRWHGGAGRLR
jgi:hypothetical protein